MQDFSIGQLPGGILGWDQRLLFLAGILLLSLAGWLAYRLVRNRPVGGSKENNGLTETRTTLITRVPPPPLPKVEKVLHKARKEFTEFAEILERVLIHYSAEEMLKNPELRKLFAHLEAILSRVERPVPRSSLGINESRGMTGDMRREAKATMLTIVRLLQELEGIEARCGEQINPLLDRLLEKV